MSCGTCVGEGKETLESVGLAVDQAMAVWALPVAQIWELLPRCPSCKHWVSPRTGICNYVHCKLRGNQVAETTSWPPGYKLLRRKIDVEAVRAETGQAAPQRPQAIVDAEGQPLAISVSDWPGVPVAKTEETEPTAMSTTVYLGEPAPTEPEAAWWVDENDRPIYCAARLGLRGPYTQQEIADLTGTDESYLHADLSADQAGGKPCYTPDYPEPAAQVASSQPLKKDQRVSWTGADGKEHSGRIEWDVREGDTQATIINDEYAVVGGGVPISRIDHIDLDRLTVIGAPPAAVVEAEAKVESEEEAEPEEPATLTDDPQAQIDAAFAEFAPTEEAHQALIELAQQAVMEYANLEDDVHAYQARDALARLSQVYAPDDPEFRQAVVEACSALVITKCLTCGRFVTADGVSGHAPTCGEGQRVRNELYKLPEIKPVSEGIVFTPQNAEAWGEVSGAKTRFRNNVAAIELLKQLEAEGRMATPEEQAILAQFVSWGGLPQVFDSTHQRTPSELIEQKMKEANEDDEEGRADVERYWDSWSRIMQRYFAPVEREAALKWPGFKGLQTYSTPRQADWEAFCEWWDSQQTEWSKEYNQLRALMSEEEWKDAARAITNAHYTSLEVVNEMWATVQHLGFEGGKVLEPAVGKGAFIMAMPEEMAARSMSVGVDRDAISVRIARQLCQQSDIRHNEYQSTQLPNDFFNLAISNVPFGQIPVYDPEFDKDGTNALLHDPDDPEGDGGRHLPSVHNYYFAKALRQVAPGGLIAFVTSRYTLDSRKAEGVRRFLAGQADLVGAMRLPNTAFKQNAGTEVTTDVIFLRKRLPGEEAGDSSWTETVPFVGADGSAMEISRYYAERPEMMLGKMESTGKMHHASGQPQLAPDGRPLAQAMREAAQRMPKDALKKTRAFKCPACSRFVSEDGRGHRTEPTPCPMIAGAFAAQAVSDQAAFDGEVRLGDNNVLYVREEGEWVKHPLADKRRKDGSEPAELQKLKAYTKVKDAMLEVIEANRNNADEAVLAEAQAALGAAYDAFVGRFGAINDPSNQRVLRGDPYRARLMALEVYNPDTGEAIKEPIFYKRLNAPAALADHADTAEEALSIALAELGALDFDRMAQLMPGRSAESLQAELLQMGLAFPTPAGWQTSEEYLSGNARRKLAEAQALAQIDPMYEANVRALEAAQPRDLLPSEIDIALGQVWIPNEDISAFTSSLLGGEWVVTHLGGSIGKWKLKPKSWFNEKSVPNIQQYGTKRIGASELIEKLLNGSEIRVYDTVEGPDGKEKRALNRDETLAAQQKAQDLKALFQKFAFEQDPARTERLANLYNQAMNCEVPREYRHPGLTLPGMSMEIPPLYESQKNAIWRIMQGGNTGLFHAVGFGKTFSAIAGGMELRRIGRRKKVMHCVPNNMLKQYTADVYRMYPQARVLSISSKMIQEAPGKSAKEKRDYVFARAAQGDWDAIVITHSAFGKIPLSEESEQAFLQEKIAEYERALEEAKAQDARSGSAKDIQKALDGFKERQKAMQARLSGRRDARIVTWEDMGIDQLFVDEADMFKNLGFPTNKTIPGVKGRASQRSEDMFMKIRAMKCRCANCGKYAPADCSTCPHCFAARSRSQSNAGVVFMTGTPIANTVSEAYVMQRYLDYDRLRQEGLLPFDAWAAQFGEDVTALEMNPSGKGYRLFTRFSRYKNLPELKRMMWRFSDVQMDAEKVGVKRPRPLGGKPRAIIAKSTPALQALIDDLADRSEHMPNDPHQDNMLKVTGDGRCAAIDLRLRASLMEKLLARFEVEYKSNQWQAEIDDAQAALRARRNELELAQRSGDKGRIDNAQKTAREAQRNLAEKTAAKPRKEAQLMDMRRLKALGWDDPSSKVNLALRDIARVYDQTTGVLTPNLTGVLDLEGPQNLATMVFCDVGTPDGSGFNLYQDMKDKLVAGVAAPQPDGTIKTIKVKPEEIAFAHDYDTDDKKLELKTMVDSGRIRVVIGSTSKLGAGTNAQRRLAMQVQIDAPWRPRDVEQREGRIVRSGNNSWLPDGAGTNSRKCAQCGRFIGRDGSGHADNCGGVTDASLVLTAPWYTEGYDDLEAHEKEARQKAWFDKTAEPALKAWEAWKPVSDKLAEARRKAEKLRAELEQGDDAKKRKQLEKAEAEAAGVEPQEGELLAALRAEQEKRKEQFALWASPQPLVARAVTEESFDVYSWQGLERKAIFINQALDKDLQQRRIDETDAMVLSAAEVKALATGDPRLIERTGLEHDLEKLERLAGQFYDQQHLARKQLKDLPDEIAKTEGQAQLFDRLAQRVEQARQADLAARAALLSQLEQAKLKEKTARDALKQAREAEKAAKKASGDRDDAPQVAAARQKVAQAEQQVEAGKKATETLKPNAESNFQLTIDGQTFMSRKEASPALIALELRVKKGTPDWRRVGEYMGLPVMGRAKGLGIELALQAGNPQDPLITVVDSSTTKEAFRLDDQSGANADWFKKALETPGINRAHYAHKLQELQARAAPLEAILGKRFEQQEELDQKRGRYKQLMAEFEAEEMASLQFGTGEEATGGAEVEPEEAEVEEED